MKRGGKRPGAGRPKRLEETKTKQVKIPVSLFEELKQVKNLSKLTIEFWQSLS